MATSKSTTTRRNPNGPEPNPSKKTAAMTADEQPTTASHGDAAQESSDAEQAEANTAAAAAELGGIADEHDETGGGDLWPEANEPEPDLAQRSRQTAELYVGGGLYMIGRTVGIHYSDQTVAEGADALAPVLEKHGGGLPPWLLRWQEELEFARWAATVGFMSYRMIQDAKAKEQAEQAAKRARQGESDDAGDGQAASGAD